MDSIRINDGAVRLMVNDDPNRVISFRPLDLGFAERVYALITHYGQAEQDWKRRAEELDASNAPPEDIFALLRELCEDAKARIDATFGERTSAAAFGDNLDPTMFEQFFNAVTPYIEAARKPKMNKYTAMAKRGSGVLRK